VKDKFERTIENRRRAAQWQRDNPERYRERQRKWREVNRERIREYNRRWRIENPEKAKEGDAKKRRENPNYDKERHARRKEDPTYREAACARAKNWRKKNPDLVNNHLPAWKKANPDRAKLHRAAAGMNRRARKKAGGKLSAKDVRELRAIGKCAVCGAADPRMEIDHIQPLSRGGTNHRSNLQLLCRPCNRSKMTKDMNEWLQERRIAHQLTE
jgi:hypothetical protein